MKKFRILFALVFVVAMLSTVALAADVNLYIGDVVYNNEDTFTVSVYSDADVATVTGFYGVLEFDNTVVEIASTSDPDSYVPDNGAGYMDIYPEGISFAKDEAIFSFDVNVLDKAAVVGTEFRLVDITVYGASFSDEVINEALAASMTVTAAATAEAPTYTVAKALATLNGVDDYYTNVWTGAYAIALNGNVATAYKVDFDADHSYTIDSVDEGEGTVAFKIAIVGAPADAEGVPSIFTTEWIAAAIAE